MVITEKRGFLSWRWTFALGCVILLLPSLNVIQWALSGPSVVSISEEKKRMNVTDALFVVMGQHELFQHWYDLIGMDPSDHQTDAETILLSTTILYGSYDAPVESGANPKISCHYNYDSGASTASATIKQRKQTGLDWCQTHYIPKTTWTQGRNQLAREALLLEKKRGKKFDFWTFADDDTQFLCYDSPKKSNRDCWKRYIRLIAGSPNELPPKATMIAIPDSRKPLDNSGWVGVSTIDAMMNTFRRELVPYVLPYADLIPVGGSEWISQAVVYCVMTTCFPSSVLVPPYMRAGNPSHRKYPRDNYTPDRIMLNVNHTFFPYMKSLNQHCKNIVYKQHQQQIGPFSTAREFNDNVPKPTIDCSPLVNRYLDWELKTLG